MTRSDRELPDTYLPHAIMAVPGEGSASAPRVFLSPQRYIQGRGILGRIAHYLALVPAKRVALLMSKRSSQNEGLRLIEGLQAGQIDFIHCAFGGECSLEEIGKHTEALADEQVDCVIAAGGGKCVDTGKALAFRLGRPIVVVPTLASNDAPCSAVSVLYSPEGVSTGVEFYPNNPAVVLVDTEVVAQADERYLVAGIGDAMATWYEARVCLLNSAAAMTAGGRPTIASAAIGEACARTLFEQGRAAAGAVAENRVDDALEAVVEANTLLSGIGFESGGLAAAHGVAQSLTALPVVESNYLHGELVAIGTLTQLVLESRNDEAVRVGEFFASVGLPIHLGQISVEKSDRSALAQIAEGTLAFPFIGNMPQALSQGIVETALLDMHALGLQVAERFGEPAYRRLHRS